MKKALKITGLSLLGLLVLLFALPYLFQDKILARVKTEVNANLNARVEFKDLSLSLFRHFPQLTIALEDLSVAGVGAFEGDTLISTRTLEASVNLMSVLSGDNMKIRGIYLRSPRIHAVVHKDGKANWEITREDTSTAAPTDTASAFSMNLERYAISDGYIRYSDESSAMHAEISGLNHSGSGDFTQDVFTLTTTTQTAATSFTYENVPYLIRTAAGVDADFHIDNRTGTYSFKNASATVNNLKLVAEGFFRLPSDTSYEMDIRFNAPSNDFKDILSLVPAIYKNDFDKIRTSGTAALSGFVRGTYSPQQLPAYDLTLGIRDGFFQYPDLPVPVKNIQVAMQVSNPDGITDHTVVNITKGHVEMGNEPFDFRLLFRNPETVQYLDAAVKGKLNLAEITRFVKLDAGTRLAGLLTADLFAKGTMSAIQQQGGPFSAGGFLQLSNLYYASKDFPHPVQNGNLKIELANSGGTADGTTVHITSGHIELGKDPFDFTLQLRNPVSTVDFAGTARGRFTLDEIKQFVDLEPGTRIGGLLQADLSFKGSKADIDASRYDRIHLAGTAAVSNVAYASKDYPDGVAIRTASLAFNPGNATLRDFEARFQGTRFTASGVLNNLVGYALDKADLQGTVHVTADKMNLNAWMGTDTAATATADSAAGPFLVPPHIDLAVHAKAGEVTYDKVVYRNVNGTLLLKDETVQLQNVSTDALGGTVAFNGSYATKNNKKAPAIAMSYDIRAVDVQKAFAAYNTVQKLMPIGKFLSGKLSSQMSMTGTLDGEMMPDFNSLNGNGSLFLIEGVLSKFQPLEQLAGTLQIGDLKEISLKDFKGHFAFTNGKVQVKPFNLKVKDIDMQVGGMHGFDQSMDYLLAMKVPRKYLGTQGNTLVNNLAAQATSKGIPVTVGELIDLNVRMGGSLTSPVIKTDLKAATGDAAREMKEQATAFVQQKVDSTRKTVKDSFNVVKKQAVSDVKTAVTQQIFGRPDSAAAGSKPLDNTKKKAEETIKNTFGNLLNKKKKAGPDASTGNQ